MGAIASQITSLTIVYSMAYLDADQRKKVPRHWPLCGEFTGERWIPRYKWPVTRKMFPFDDVIMKDGDFSKRQEGQNILRFVQAKDQEHIKALHYWSLWWVIRGFLSQTDSNAELKAVFFVVSLNKLLNEQYNFRLLAAPWPLGDISVMTVKNE